MCQKMERMTGHLKQIQMNKEISMNKQISVQICTKKVEEVEAMIRKR